MIKVQHYKNAVIIGKFMPPHRGHDFLITTASTYCDRVTVILYYKATDPIPGLIRKEALQGQYAGTNVTIRSLEHDWPEQPDGTEEFWNNYVDSIRELAGYIDVVIGGETYIVELARRLGVVPFLVNRNKYLHISGTNIRESPRIAWWNVIRTIKHYYTNVFVICGPESSGKTTLCKQLAVYRMGGYVEEYGRIYSTHIKEWKPQHFRNIAAQQEDMIKSRLKSGIYREIFVDTDALVSQTFSKMYIGEENKHIEEIIPDLSKRLYFLLKPDLEYYQDGNRRTEHQREEHYEYTLELLQRHKKPFYIVAGEDKFEKILNFVFNFEGQDKTVQREGSYPEKAISGV